MDASLGFAPEVGVDSLEGDFVTARWCGLEAALGSLGCVPEVPGPDVPGDGDVCAMAMTEMSTPAAATALTVKVFIRPPAE